MEGRVEGGWMEERVEGGGWRGGLREVDGGEG